jgi:hypothetical protein
MKRIHFILIILVFWQFNLFASNDTLIFDMNGIIAWDDSITIPLSLTSDRTITSFDFSVKFNHSVLQYHSYSNLKSYLNNTAYYNQYDSTLRLGSYSFSSIQVNTPLLLICFDIVSGIPSAADLSLATALINGEPCIVKIKGNLCPGIPLTLSAPYSHNYTYNWNTGEQSRTISTNNPGIYYAMVTPPGGNSFMSVVTQLKNHPVSLSVFPVGTVEFCPGDSVQLNAQTEIGNQLIWSTGESGNRVYKKVPGTYYVTATNTSGCRMTSSEAHLHLLTQPNNQISINGEVSFCEGDSVRFSAVEESGNTYLWSNGMSNWEIVVKTGGTYSVLITGLNGCKATSSPIPVNVFPLPEAHIVYNGQSTLCQGDSIVLTATEGEGYHYLWSTLDTLKSIAAYQAGNYSVMITDINGCSDLSESVSVSVLSLMGDLNQDGKVSSTDYLMVTGRFGRSCSGCPEDLNQDGIVNTSDYLQVVAYYGQMCRL